MWLAACFVLLAQVEASADQTAPATTVVVIVGEPGEAKYGEMFVQWAARWKEASAKSASRHIEIGLGDGESAEKSDREILSETITKLTAAPPETLWLVFIGHGTFDGKKAKFNLRGADITAAELAEQLQPVSARTAIVNCASASGPFASKLAGANRVIVTATQSGYEYNFARFGDFLSRTIGDASGDLDKDGHTSLLEAWLAAAKQTQQYYEAESQLATEHSLLDDNGDGKGTPFDWFRGIHITKTAKDGTLPDGTFANQFILVPGKDATLLSDELLSRRDELERQLAQLRQHKGDLSEEDYLKRLEEILVPLAQLYESADTTEKPSEPQPPVAENAEKS
ncbi:hypothetical protein C5Y97_24135 [Blastopirellula marina]|uniref:Uncharacterized protein n=2 Tax=Blastopirellula marina TaxID=124 RepID=A0A2S8F9X4_9BACT|nr:hypothetical protein C5Y98_24120 [Blastopirellula marina]PTL42242.1 hypothetical protein C5Y97_24135 [Blastopirellula marina]